MAVKKYIITNATKTKFLAKDGSSGGYPYWTDDPSCAATWSSVQDAISYQEPNKYVYATNEVAYVAKLTYNVDIIPMSTSDVEDMKIKKALENLPEDVQRLIEDRLKGK